MDLRAFGRDLIRGVFRTTPAFDSPRAQQNARALRVITDMIPPEIDHRVGAGASAGELYLAALLSNVRTVASLGRTPAETGELPAPDQVLVTMERLLANTGWLQVEARTRDRGITVEGSCVDDRGRPWQWRRDSDGTNTLVRDAV